MHKGRKRLIFSDTDIRTCRICGAEKLINDFINHERRDQHGVVYKQYEKICKKCNSVHNTGMIVGGCIDCGEKKEIYASGHNCKPCSAKRSREWRARKRKEGFCSCGREKAEGDLNKCLRCRKQKTIQGKRPCVKEYQIRNAVRISVMGKQRIREQKAIVLKQYGEACKCCGEARFEFLTIDHINSDGATHRKEIKTTTLYRWLIANNFPPGFQTLCMNCNFAKGKYGFCPHGNLPEALPPAISIQDMEVPPLMQAPHRYPIALE